MGGYFFKFASKSATIFIRRASDSAVAHARRRVFLLRIGDEVEQLGSPSLAGGVHQSRSSP
jgi:hypothetical protein